MKRIFLLAFALCACAHTTTTSTFQLASATFAAGATMPDSTVLNGLDCHGPNASPQLRGSGGPAAPAGTKTHARTLDDYEARGADGSTHGVPYNIPAPTTEPAENAGAGEP